MALVEEGAGHSRSGLEHELRELERQRDEVESRLKELEAKERFHGSSGARSSGRLPSNPSRGSIAPLKRHRDDDYRPLRTSNPNFPHKRRFIENPIPRGPIITSTVVKVNEKDPEKPQPSLVLKNEEDKKRSKNLFGVLMGTLQQFKKETEQKTDVESKRQEIEQKVESKVQTERNEFNERQKKTIEEEIKRNLARKNELAQKQEEIELELMEQKWAKHHALVSSFHRTQTKPHICFMLNPKAPPFEIKKPNLDQDNNSKDDKGKEGKARDASSSSESESEGEGNREGNGKPEDKMDTEKTSKEKASGSEKEDN